MTPDDVSDIVIVMFEHHVPFELAMGVGVTPSRKPPPL